jgi:flagellin
MSIYVSSEGNIGPKVSINKSLLLSALTIDATDMTSSTWIATENTNNDDAWSFASQTYAVAISLGAISVGVFTQALENIATLRADNGGTMSRLEFASDNVTLQSKNFTAANGRIVDVDIASESTNLAKYNILSQASASMIAQANSSMDMALMLLR